MPDVAGAAIDLVAQKIMQEGVASAAPPYVALGHDEGLYFFISAKGGQVMPYRARELGTHAALVEIADSAHWRAAYPKKGDWCDMRAAAEALMDEARRVGVYDPRRQRGRGAWLDGDDVLMHLGDRIVLGGQSMPPQARSGQWIYQLRQALPLQLGDMGSTEAARLVDLCCAASWEDPGSMGRLLAGWIVTALVCGAMPWRPHLWVTGESGAGKTWLVQNVIEPALGGVKLSVEGKTTEPGIRRELGADALAVVFDEPETQNRDDRKRVREVIDLSRHSSSEAGARVLKAARDSDKVARTEIRSSFLFSSINVAVTQAADLSRFMILTLRKPATPELREQAFARLEALQREVMVPGYSGRLLGRTLRLVPVIRANAGAFCRAIAATSDRRMGDTLGVLLAGAWSLGSEAVLTDAQAVEVLQRNGWIRQTADSATVTPEWRQALDHLLQARVEVQPSNGRVERIAVAELIDILEPAPDADDRPAVIADVARRALARFGVLVDGAGVRFANTSTAIGACFSGSPWEAAWRTTILRAPGSERSGRRVARFAVPSAYVQIPLKVVMGAE